MEDIEIIRNKIKCLKCGEVIESKHRHNFVICSCDSVAVDGGTEYLRYVGDSKDYDTSYKIVRENNKISYKYNLEDYKECFFLYDDMRDLYNKYELHLDNPTRATEFNLIESLQTLHYSIKHRTVEGYLPVKEREEMWSYFWGLVYD